MAVVRIRADGPAELAQRPVNDESLRERENDHRLTLVQEHRAVEHRFLAKLARGAASADVWSAVGGKPERRHLLNVLAEHPRLLLTGSRWSGKSTLAAFLLAQAARRNLGLGDPTPLAVIVRRLPSSELDEDTLARMNPAAGPDVVYGALEEGSALVVIDGLDEAGSPEELKRSLAALAGRHPRARFIALSRPLPARVPGRSETVIDGFVTLPLAGPPEGAVVRELRPRPAAERAVELAAEVDALFERWSFEQLPPGSALRDLTERGRYLVATHLAAGSYDARRVELPEDVLVDEIAAELADARWFPETGQLLHGDEDPPPGGERVADPKALAARIADAVRRSPGVLVESRPSAFAFASLAVQRYLTATFFARERFFHDHFVMLEDTWWHPVLVMMAGLPAPCTSSSPPRVLIGELLRQFVTPDSVATFLADQAAEIARDLPPALRREIDRRLRAAVPLRSDAQLAHVVDDIGDIAAPALLRSLDDAGPNERARMLTALGRLDHPGAVRALARFASDEERTTEPMLCWAWHVSAVAAGMPVGFFAFAAFFNLALSSPAAHALYDQVLARTSEETRAQFIEIVVSKFLHDAQWGADALDERDPLRSAGLMEKLVAAQPPSDVD